MNDGEERDATEEAVDVRLDAAVLDFAKAVLRRACLGDEVTAPSTR